VGAYLQSAARVAGPGCRVRDWDGRWSPRQQQHITKLGSSSINSAQPSKSYDFIGSTYPYADDFPADPIPNRHLAVAGKCRFARPQDYAGCGFPRDDRLTGVHARVGRGTP
jgi:hypothetical protein